MSMLEYPGTVAFLDDERHFLDGLSVAVPEDFVCQFFQKPQRCIDFLLGQVPAWQSQKLAMAQLVGRSEVPGALLEGLVGGLYASHARFELATVLVVDFQMPAMNGLTVLDQLKNWPGKRVMLTGQADEQLAVDAFNRGLIDHFIPKHAPDSLDRLATVVSVLRCEGADQCGEALKLKLTPAQQVLLADPAFALAVNVQAKAAGWVEHAIVPEPFGVLGVTAEGKIQWLQLETEPSLQELAEILNDAGHAQSLVDQVRAGAVLLAVELPAGLLQGEPQARGAFTLLHEPRVVGALMTLLPQAASYAQFRGTAAGQSRFL
jgi:CheY-like chemotaxis protein